MARQMKDSGIEWIGDIPEDWGIARTKSFFTHHKHVAGETAEQYERLALTLNGVIRRPKDDSTGLQPEAFNGYQILRQNELVFKLIDLENVATSRVGYSPYTGIVSPAYIVLAPREENESKFGEYFFLSMWQREIFNHMGDDGVRSSLNSGDLLNIPYPIAPADEKRRIVAFLDRKCAEIDAVIERTKATIEEYKKLKQAVITEAVTKGVRGPRPMKDSGIEWIGEIPTEWKLAKLKSITTEIGDGLHATPEYDAEGEYYFVNGNCIGGDRLVFKKNTDKLNENEYRKYKAPLINCNTIMIALNGTYGKTSFYHNEKVLLGKSAGYITLLPNINKRFVRYYLLSDSAYRIMELSLCGTTIPNLSLYTLRNFSTPIPSDEEMDEIVSYLDKQCKKLDNLIAKKTALLTELETYKKSLIYEYVTGKKEVIL